MRYGHPGLALRTLAAEALVTKLDAEIAVDVVFSSVIEALARGEDVRLSRLGTITTRSCLARTGRNPRILESVDISVSTTPMFKPSKVLRAAVTEA